MSQPGNKPQIRGKVIIDKDRCKGCEYCVLACPTKCLEMSEEINVRGVKYAVMARPDDCIACGLCARTCPDVCINVQRRKGGQLYMKVEDTITKIIDTGLEKIRSTQHNNSEKDK